MLYTPTGAFNIIQMKEGCNDRLKIGLFCVSVFYFWMFEKHNHTCRVSKKNQCKIISELIFIRALSIKFLCSVSYVVFLLVNFGFQ